jgi:hypothetical protein
MNLPDQLIGYRVFTDRANRPIFQQADGRQYVLLDEEGTKEYGVWQLPEPELDRPIVVPGGRVTFRTGDPCPIRC